MWMSASTCEHFARLFSYPDREYSSTLDLLRRDSGLPPAISEKLNPLALLVKKSPLVEVQELFTKTFDMNPQSCLEVGWHLFGEDYQRGSFLVKMKRALAEAGVAETVELPDHVSQCLRLLCRLESDEGEAFIRRYLLPPLERMPGTLPLDSPYRALLECVKGFLEQQGRLASHDGGQWPASTGRWSRTNPS